MPVEARTSRTITDAISLAVIWLFEVVQRVREVNRERRRNAPDRRFSGSSCHAGELSAHPELEAAYIIAPPRMAF